MSGFQPLVVHLPSEEDAKLAKESKRILARRLRGATTGGSREKAVKIPASAAHLLMQILDEISRGNAVKLVPVHAELTTQEAAELLNVSRPTVIRLLEKGEIEFHKVGSHRRVPMKSALAYKRQIEEGRRAALAELTAYDQELGL